MSTDLEAKTAVISTESDELETDVSPDSLSRRLPSADPSTTEEIQAFGVRLRFYMDELLRKVGDLYETYQKPLKLLGVFLVALLGIAISNGVLNVLNAIPLAKPVLEMVGMGYLGWFTWRYLRYADTRQELAQEYCLFKTRVIGDAAVHMEAAD